MAAGVGILGLQQAQAIQLNWASVGNAQLVFKGAVGGGSPQAPSFSFKHDTISGFDFSVNSTVTSAAPSTLANPDSAVGDLGLFTGVFTLSNITETPNGGNPQANGIYLDTATVTASVGAEVIIVDKGYNAALGLAHASNLAHEFKGTVSFDTIVMLYQRTGPGSHDLNLLADGISSAANNVTGGTYTGTQLDLLALASAPAKLSGSWSYNFKSLPDMAKVGAGNNSVSAAGNFQSPATVPDGGMTLVLLGFALSGMVLMKRQLA